LNERREASFKASHRERFMSAGRSEYTYAAIPMEPAHLRLAMVKKTPLRCARRIRSQRLI
jgi:hypothetical protein